MLYYIHLKLLEGFKHTYLLNQKVKIKSEIGKKEIIFAKPLKLHTSKVGIS